MKQPKFEERDWVRIMPLATSYAWAEPAIGVVVKRFIGYSGRWVYDVEVDGEVHPEIAESRMEVAA